MIIYLAILLILAALSSRIASKIGVPGLIIFLGLGMLFGSEGLNLIYLDDHVLVQQIAIAALIIILFEGGFSTQKKQIELSLGPAVSLATVGVIVTAICLGILSHLVLGLDIYSSILIGTIVASTDAAAVLSMFRNKKIEPRTSSTLEIESASNDPVAILLTITMIDLILDTLAAPAFIILHLLWQIGAGFGVGIIIGKAGPYMLNKLKLESGGFYYVLALGLCFLSYSLADEIQANGFLAVFMAGLIIGNKEFVYKQGILRFLEGTSTFSQVLLFLLLGLLVIPSELMDLWKPGIIIAFILMFVARPVAVIVSTIFWKFSLNERVMLCWGGMKGAVPIVLATYPMVAGVDPGGFYFNIVFFVVLLSALIQGSTIDIVSKKLGLLTGSFEKSPHSMELVSLEKSRCELLEFDVNQNSKLIGKKIKNINLPPNCLITAIVRKNDIITPKGKTSIHAGDLLFILTRYEDKERLLHLLRFPENSEKNEQTDA